MDIDTTWTPEQVAHLNEWQQRGEFHPFTCGNGSHILRATPDGWVCDECAAQGKTYEQKWCHDFMADGDKP